MTYPACKALSWAVLMLRLLAFVFLVGLPQQSFAAVCKAGEPEDFSAFFTHFSDDKPFAVSRTLFPLRQLRWEYGIDSKGNDVSSPVPSRASKAEFSATPSLSGVHAGKRLGFEDQETRCPHRGR
ncbi:MAG: hypothetical protein H6R10_2345 [Rhodocyclaceae bacterium]|nr:hypothetical protein [Rhodocyclaceae bacterium]